MSGSSRGSKGNGGRSDAGVLRTAGIAFFVQLAAGLGWVAEQSAQALAPLELGRTRAFLAASAGGPFPLPATSVFAVVALVLLAVLGPLATRLIGPRGKIVATLAMLAFVPLVVVVARARLDVPIASWWWGARLSDAWPHLPTGFYATGMAGGLVAVVVAARPWRLFDRALAVAAPVVLALGVVLVGAAVRRSAVKVDPSRFMGSMAFVARIAPLAPHAYVAGGFSEAIEAPNGIRLRRVCYETSFSDLAPVPECAIFIDKGEGEPKASAFDIPPSSALTLWYDASTRFFLLDEDGRRARAFDDTGKPIDITIAAVADRLGPPRAWMFVSAAGLLAGAVAFWLARRSQEALAAIAGGTAGSFDGARWIHVADESPLRKPDDLVAKAGPVVVIGGSGLEPPSSAYRVDRSRRRASVVSGAKEDLVRHFGDAASARRAFAVVAVVVTSAPLVAALLRGLVV